MELFLDIDGVILDFEGAFTDFIRDQYMPDLPTDFGPKTWDMVNEFEGVDIDEAWDIFVNSERFRRVNLLIEANSFNQLSEKYPLYLVSNLPLEQFSGREENLKYHSLNYKELHLAGHYNFGLETYPTKSEKIAKLRHENKRLVFLDDHPTNCKDVKNRFPESEVFLMSRPHNRNAESSTWTRVSNWDEFVEKIEPKAV